MRNWKAPLAVVVLGVIAFAALGPADAGARVFDAEVEFDRFGRTSRLYPITSTGLTGSLPDLGRTQARLYDDIGIARYPKASRPSHVRVRGLTSGCRVQVQAERWDGLKRTITFTKNGRRALPLKVRGKMVEGTIRISCPEWE